MPLRRHLEATWRALSDVCLLAIFYCLGFGVALLTDPRLHWTHRMGSPALDRMVRSGQVWWGIYAFGIAALSLWQPRISGVGGIACSRHSDGTYRAMRDGSLFCRT